MSTINNLLYHLGAGARKNKFLVEIGRYGIDGEKFNCLCTTASFPQRTIQTASVFRHGRKYNMRSEVSHGDTYEITVIDDENLTLRKFFDRWMDDIDDSSKEGSDFFGLTSKDSMFQKFIDAGKGIYDTINGINQILSDPKKFGERILNNVLSGTANGTYPPRDYQSELTVWQLDHSGKKVYGYQLENAFPSELGSITYDDSEQNSIVSYNVTFTFSEFKTTLGVNS